MQYSADRAQDPDALVIQVFLSCAFRAVTWESCNTLPTQSQTADYSKLLFYIGSYCIHMCRLLFPNPAFNVSAPRLLIFPCATSIPAAKDVSSPLCGFSSQSLHFFKGTLADFSTSNSLCLYLQLLLLELTTTTPFSVDFPYVNLQVSIPMAAFASPPQSSPYIWLLVSWYAAPGPPLCVLACQHSLFPSPFPPPSLSLSLNLFFPSSLSSSCRPSTLFYQNMAQSKKGEQRGTGPVGGVKMDGRKRG